MKVYDATEQILGRMSTQVAKELMRGETVHVVNCEKACISGDPVVTKKHYLERRQRGDPHHGPFYPRTPRRIVKMAQRIGRSEHKPGLPAQGLVFTRSIDDFFETSAIIKMLAENEMENPVLFKNSLDVLAQQTIGIVLAHKGIFLKEPIEPHPF